MPDNESKDRHEKIVYWPEDGHNEFGEYKLGEPIEVNARVERRKRLTSDPQRQTVDHDHIINVDRDMTEGGTIYLGGIDELTVGNVVDTLRIVDFEKVPDIKGRKFDRHVLVKRDRKKEITVAPLLYNAAVVFYNGQPLFYNLGKRRSDEVIIEDDPVIPTPTPGEFATDVVLDFTPGDISGSAWATFRNSLPVNPTTLRPQPSTFNLSQGVSASFGRPIVGDQFEVPTMEANGWFNCYGVSNPHDPHNMLFLASPEGKLHPLHGAYAQHNIPYELQMEIDLTDALLDYQQKRWIIVWQLHPATFPPGWGSNKQPPLSLALIKGKWRVEHRWESDNAGTDYDHEILGASYPATVGRHNLKMQWIQDHTGTNSFVKVWVDGQVIYESLNQNAINYSGLPGGVPASTVSVGNYQSSGDPVFPSLHLGTTKLLRGTAV